MPLASNVLERDEVLQAGHARSQRDLAKDDGAVRGLGEVEVDPRDVRVVQARRAATGEREIREAWSADGDHLLEEELLADVPPRQVVLTIPKRLRIFFRFDRRLLGELLGWHPHLHLLVTDGGYLADGSFRHLLWVDGETVKRLWRAEVLRLLVERGKIAQEVVAR